ncbi:MAG: beta-ketoacyl synthase [Prevotella sp.]|nr:beta-ketoacyl synthase [Prevotella sp.]
MIRKIADNIYSPLGFTTAENYASVKAGKSRLRRYEGAMGLPDPFTASLLDWQQVEPLDGYTRFETIAIHSARQALAQTGADPASPKVLFVVSTTKGNVDLLDAPSGTFPADRVHLGVAARKVATYFNNPNQPLVVSNACISGLSAQITAMRLLEGGDYETAVVIGADVQSRFIISGFLSLMALSPMACRPFDIERVGLNLGEAAATIIYTNMGTVGPDEWQAVGGAVRNDAHHISNPSRTGEGCYRAIRAALGNTPVEDLAFVNAHGTSTLYNDEMEAVAIHRAGLSEVPVNSLKGYYGHTMGAAGVLETILSMAAVDDGCVLGTRGFEELGVSRPVRLSAQNGQTTKRSFVKLLSGFGGCNAAMLFRKGGAR